MPLNALSFALGRPSFGGGLFQVGQQAGATGAMPGYNESVKAAQQQEVEKQQGLLNLADMARMGAQPESLAAMEQSLAARTKADASQLGTARQSGAAQATAQASAQQAQMQKIALARYLAGPQAKRPDLAEMALLGTIDTSNYKDFMKVAEGGFTLKPGEKRFDAKGKVLAEFPQSSMPSLETKGQPSMFKDDEDNYYQGILVQQGNEFVTRMTPVGGAPEDFVGNLVPVSRTTGEGLAGTIEAQQNQKWSDARDEIIGNIPEMYDTKAKVGRALQIAAEIPTSGVRAGITGFKDFLGLGDTASDAQLNNAMADFVLASIKKLGTAPTDADLKFLTDSLPTMRKGSEANVALLKQSLEVLNRSLTAREYLLDNPNASRDDYIKNYTSLFDKNDEARQEAEKKGQKPVSFADMPKG